MAYTEFDMFVLDGMGFSAEYIVNPGSGTVTLQILGTMNPAPHVLDPAYDDIANVTELLETVGGTQASTITVTGSPDTIQITDTAGLLRHYTAVWVAKDFGTAPGKMAYRGGSPRPRGM